MVDSDLMGALPHNLLRAIRAVEAIHKEISAEESWGTSMYPNFRNTNAERESAPDLPSLHPSDSSLFPPALSDLGYIIASPKIRDLLNQREYPSSEEFVLTTDKGPAHLQPGVVYKMQAAERDLQIVFTRFGFLTSPATLQEIADQHSITRERVRQILRKRQNKAYMGLRLVPQSNVPVLFAVMNLLMELAKAISTIPHKQSAPPIESNSRDNLSIATVFEIIEHLIDLQLVSSAAQIMAIMNWFEELLIRLTDVYRFEHSLGTQSIWNQLCKHHWSGVIFFGSLSEGETISGKSIATALSMWRQLIIALNTPLLEYNGAAQSAVKTFKSRGAVELVSTDERDQVVRYLRMQGHQVLVALHWVVRLDTGRNTLRDGIGRLLTMLGPLAVSYIRDGISATKPGRTEYSIEMTEDVLSNILENTNWCTYMDGKWQWNGAVVSVGDKDLAVYRVLRNLPPVFFYYEAVQAVDGICSVANLNFFLKGPYGASPKHNMYCLRGTEFNAFDLARSPKRGIVAHAKASSYFASHDPDIVHVEAPSHWNSQVSLGRFYDGDWAIVHGSSKRPGKVRKGILFSGVLPLLKQKSVGFCFDLTLNEKDRTIRISKCAVGARHSSSLNVN
jgi:hypothetical protein